MRVFRIGPHVLPREGTYPYVGTPFSHWGRWVSHLRMLKGRAARKTGGIVEWDAGLRLCLILLKDFGAYYMWNVALCMAYQ